MHYYAKRSCKNFYSSFVYFLTAAAAQNITISSVIGIASHRDSAPASAGRIKIRIPLTTNPLPTDTINAAVGFIIAYK